MQCEPSYESDGSSMDQAGQSPATAICGVPQAATFDSGQASVDYSLYQPANDAPGYAYPLIVWFHDDGADEQDVLDWLPQISPQNYLGLGLRGPLPVKNGLPGQRRWSLGPEHLQWLEDQLAVALVDLCATRRIHTGRIVAAGVGQGGSVALQMLLRQPELFAAAACLNADLQARKRLGAWGRYAGRSVWLGHSELLGRSGKQPAIDARTLLHTAGLSVESRLYDDQEWPLETFGRELDWWLMRTLCAETVIG